MGQPCRCPCAGGAAAGSSAAGRSAGTRCSGTLLSPASAPTKAGRPRLPREPADDRAGHLTTSRSSAECASPHPWASRPGLPGAPPPRASLVNGQVDLQAEALAAVRQGSTRSRRAGGHVGRSNPRPRGPGSPRRARGCLACKLGQNPRSCSWALWDSTRARARDAPGKGGLASSRPRMWLPRLMTTASPPGKWSLR